MEPAAVRSSGRAVASAAAATSRWCRTARLTSSAWFAGSRSTGNERTHPRLKMIPTTATGPPVKTHATAMTAGKPSEVVPARTATHIISSPNSNASPTDMRYDLPAPDTCCRSAVLAAAAADATDGCRSGQVIATSASRPLGTAGVRAVTTASPPPR